MDHIFPIVKLPLEIQECILLWLGRTDLRTVLLAQRVCRQWRDAIQGCPAIQKVLYFRPIQSADEDDERVNDDKFNPLLHSHFGRILKAVRTTSDENDRAERLLENVHFTGLPWAKTERTRSKFLDKDSTWRRMLVSRRPIRRLLIAQIIRGMHGTSLYFSSVDFSTYGDWGSMTMGAYYDLLLSGAVSGSRRSSWFLCPGKAMTRRSHFQRWEKPPVDRSLTLQLSPHPSEQYYKDNPGMWRFPEIAHYLKPSKDSAVLLTSKSLSCVQYGIDMRNESWMPLRIEIPPQIVKEENGGFLDLMLGNLD